MEFLDEFDKRLLDIVRSSKNPRETIGVANRIIHELKKQREEEKNEQARA